MLTHRDNVRSLPKMIGARLVITAFTTFGVTFAIFGLAAVSPFDPLAHHLGSDYGSYTDAELAEIAASLGMDRPWWGQWLYWWQHLLQGDLGWSRIYHKPVADVIVERLPWTLLLSAVGLAILMLLAVVLGILSARHPHGLVDRCVTAVGVFIAATPSYVYALGTVLFFGLLLHAIPIGGAAPIGREPSLANVGPYLIAPACVLAISQLSWPLLAMQQAARDASASEAVRTARLRGLSQRKILLRHILPMSLMPLVTLIGARLSELVVGALIVETVFSWPGLAFATVESAIAVDFPLLAFITAATTVVVMLGSLASDIAYVLIDPRVTDV